MVVGAQKSGTTSLIRYLGQHPTVCSHEQTEFTYFFGDRQYRWGYETAFDTYFRSCPDESVIFAKHVMLMYSEEGIERLKHHNPDCCVVLLLRDPVKRAYSAYWYARQLGAEAIDCFEDALKAEKQRLDQDGWERWRQCAYVSNGIYDEPVSRIFKCFGTERVFVYTTDELSKHPQRICSDIFEACGLSDYEVDAQQRLNTAKKARSELLARAQTWLLDPDNPLKQRLREVLPISILQRISRHVRFLNSTGFDRPPMRDDTRQQLGRAFRPHNQRLSQLIGKDLSSWTGMGDV
jgi:hypothetical protein